MACQLALAAAQRSLLLAQRPPPHVATALHLQPVLPWLRRLPSAVAHHARSMALAGSRWDCSQALVVLLTLAVSLSVMAS